jgi:hypothetical protein
VDDFSVEADEEAHAPVNVFPGVPHAVGIGDFSVRVGDQGELQFILRDEFEMAVGGEGASPKNWHNSSASLRFKN